MSNATLSPVAVNERITTLDVIRGVALFGIFLMNVEFFNRPLADLDAGLPMGAHGLDFWAGWFVHVFVRGKFWTMFSLLFGMGFAVMLTRAEAAGRDFRMPYLRRTLALGVMGTLHYIFLWAGDILLSYALAAAFLMVAFYARPRLLMWIGGLAVLVGAALGGAKAAGVADLPWGPFLMVGFPVLLFGVVGWALHRSPLNGLRNAGLALYLVPFLAMTIGGALTPQQTLAERERAQLAEATTPAERAEVIKSQREQAKERKEHVDTIEAEAKVLSQGTYAEVVAFRANEFPKHLVQQVFFGVIVLGMFLLGAWFVRSGVMAYPGAHLDLFRKLALFGIPVGIGISIVSASIATTHIRGVNDALFQFSMGLAMVGNLAACLGYVGAIVLLFHSRFRAWLMPFAYVGRMALSNYIFQSLVSTLFFYGYGLGQWGMHRAAQLVFVVVVFAVQLVLCRWWLKHFRYGPLEWAWRSFTYLRVPSMRLERLQPA